MKKASLTITGLHVDSGSVEYETLVGKVSGLMNRECLAEDGYSMSIMCVTRDCLSRYIESSH